MSINRISILFRVLCLSLAVLITPTMYAGTFVTHNIQSPAIASNTMGISDMRRIVVHLPEGYDAGMDSYPVVYWIGGWSSPLERFTIGLNDGSAYYAGFYELHVGREGELPKALEADFNSGIDTWKNMPASLADYNTTASQTAQIFIQLGVAISPNPAVPLHFDAPVDSNGKPVSEVLEKWRAYCLFDPATIVKYLATLQNLSTVVVIIPAEQENPAATNRYQNIYWLDLMTVAGVPVTRLDMPGGHSDFAVERLVALQKHMLASLGGD